VIFSILQYIIHPQEVSEQSTHYFYKSKLMVDLLVMLHQSLMQQKHAGAGDEEIEKYVG
jgi:hypothetical protein